VRLTRQYCAGRFGVTGALNGGNPLAVGAGRSFSQVRDRPLHQCATDGKYQRSVSGQQHRLEFGHMHGDVVGRGTILLVSNETLTRMDLVGELRRAQFKVKQARNGDHALGVLGTAADVDIVISDVWMPGCTDGVALAAWLRIRRPEVRVVLMCPDLPPLAALAADVVVSKPLSEVDLVVDLLPLLGTGS
jgi:CheY-like chemotaxis protein